MQGHTEGKEITQKGWLCIGLQEMQKRVFAREARSSYRDAHKTSSIILRHQAARQVAHPTFSLVLKRQTPSR